MDTISKRLDNVKIKNKLWIIIIFCVLVPIIITNLLFFYLMNENIKKEQEYSMEYQLQTIDGNIDVLFKSCLELSSIIYFDKELKQFITYEFSSLYEYIDQYYDMFRNYFEIYKSTYSQVNNITIYIDNKYLESAGHLMQLDEEVRDSTWYKNYIANRKDKSIVFQVTEENILSGYEKRFSLIRELDCGEIECILRIDMNLDYINNNLKIGTDDEIYIVNPDNEIIFTTEENKYFEKYNEQIIMKKSNKVSMHRSLPIKHSKGNWNFILIHNKINLLNQKNSQFIIMGLLFINVLLPILAVRIVSSSLRKRLEMTILHIEGIKSQKFEIMECEETHDEIGELISSLNTTITIIKNLIKDVYQANIKTQKKEIQRKQSEINALQSQIDPHFLFNIFEAIRMRSLIKGEKETADIIKKLASIFRSSVSWNEDMITIEKEMTLVSSYLDLIKYRLGDKLTFNLIMDNEVKECLIPKMAITTFVENACIHGVQQISSEGYIEIKVLYLGEWIECIIEDNGKGMTDQEIIKLKEYIVKDEIMEKHVGVKNVIRRMLLHYNEFDYDIVSKSQGIKVYFKIPVVRGSKDV